MSANNERIKFIGGLVAGVAAGYGAAKLAERFKKPRKPFRPPILPYRPTEEISKDSTGAASGLDEANKMPEGD